MVSYQQPNESSLSIIVRVILGSQQLFPVQNVLMKFVVRKIFIVLTNHFYNSANRKKKSLWNLFIQWLAFQKYLICQELENKIHLKRKSTEFLFHVTSIQKSRQFCMKFSIFLPYLILHSLKIQRSGERQCEWISFIAKANNPYKVISKMLPTGNNN